MLYSVLVFIYFIALFYCGTNTEKYCTVRNESHCQGNTSVKLQKELTITLMDRKQSHLKANEINESMLRNAIYQFLRLKRESLLDKDNQTAQHKGEGDKRLLVKGLLSLLKPLNLELNKELLEDVVKNLRYNITQVIEGGTVKNYYITNETNSESQQDYGSETTTEMLEKDYGDEATITEDSNDNEEVANNGTTTKSRKTSTSKGKASTTKGKTTKARKKSKTSKASEGTTEETETPEYTKDVTETEVATPKESEKPSDFADTIRRVRGIWIAGRCRCNYVIRSHAYRMRQNLFMLYVINLLLRLIST